MVRKGEPSSSVPKAYTGGMPGCGNRGDFRLADEAVGVGPGQQNLERDFAVEGAVDGAADIGNRDNRTAIELFLAGIRGWKAGLRQRLGKGKSKPE